MGRKSNACGGRVGSGSKCLSRKNEQKENSERKRISEPRRGSLSASRMASTIAVQPRTTPNSTHSLLSKQSCKPEKRYSIAGRFAVVVKLCTEAASMPRSGVRPMGLLEPDMRSAAIAISNRWPLAKAACWARCRLFALRMECRSTPTGHRSAWNFGSCNRGSLAPRLRATKCCQDSSEMPLSLTSSCSRVLKGPEQRWLWVRIKTESTVFHNEAPACTI